MFEFKSLRLFASLTVLAATCLAAHAAEFYVAPDGDDANPGTEQKPFASLERARDAVRAIDSREGGVTVWLRGGVYERSQTFELSEPDSGTPGAPIVYRARPGETVRILGGRQLEPSAVTPVTDEGILNRIIDASARTKVRHLDLRALGIEDCGTLLPRGFRRPYIPAPLELFINDEALHLARWPNDDTVLIGDILDPGSVPRDNDFSNRGGSFTFDFDRPSLWTRAHDIWLTGLFGYGFADDTIKVASIEPDRKAITMAHPHMYGLKSGREFHRYYAFNLLEEIDAPGEYYVDRESGNVYFYPPEGEPLDRIAISMLEEPLVAMEGVSQVTIRDITFEVTRGMGIYIEGGTGNCVAGCTLRNMGIVAVCIGMGIEPDALYRHEMTGKPVSRQLGSWHEHIYANSVFDRRAGTGHVVLGCDIYNTGAGGVSLGGGDRVTLTPGNNAVRNCHIYRFNRLDKSYKAAVNIDGVGNRVENCLIHDCPNNAIYLHGNDHLITLNEVHHTCLDADDMGVFYMGRDPSEQGNVIRHNFFHHNGNDHGATCVVYFDDDACGTLVDGNVFWKNKGNPIWMNGGCDHIYTHNVFADSPGTVPEGRDKRNYDWKTDELQHPRLREVVDVTQPPYSERYPRLLEAYENDSGRGRGNDVFRNISIRSGSFGGGTNTLADNWETDQDAAFANLAAGDFAVIDPAVLQEQVPGFESIPFDRIGLYLDEYRQTMPLPEPIIEPGSRAFVDRLRVTLAARAGRLVYSLDGSVPTVNSAPYDGPFEITEPVLLRARAIHPENPAVASGIIEHEYVKVDAKLPQHVKVNFQLDSAPRPEGYLIDTGAAFAVRDGGYAYGWSSDNTEAARHRGINASVLLDTLVHFTAGVVWEIAVAPGVYEVTVWVGDPQYEMTGGTLFVEDTEFCRGLKLAPNDFHVITKEVTVEDGAMTFRSNDKPHGPELMRMNWLEIHAK